MGFAASNPTDQPASPVNQAVRDYICSLSNQLAAMARNCGDEPLAVLLEAAADRAATYS